MAGKFELKKAKNGDFHFNLLATNGQIILGSEMYKTKASAENGIASIMKNAADDARFERLVSSNEKPYFVLKAANHQIIGQSQMYESVASRDNGIESVKKNAPDAKIEDLTA
ncbi:MAG: YegP family protein [Methylococcaceae bacterium]|nr:YegP family protein [Methylococcaceae bacterium]